MNFRKPLANAGYDQEEAFFFERDQELIAKKREERNKSEAKPELRLVNGGKPGEDIPTLPRGITAKKAA